MSKDSFALSSGLLNNFQHQVETAWFGEDEESDSEFSVGRLFLFMQGPSFVDGELESEDHRERLSIGNGWEVVDEGAAVEKANPRFNRNSGIGRWISQAAAAGDEVIDLIAGRGDAYEAKTYEGLTVTYGDRVEVSKFKNEDGEEVVVEALQILDVEEAGKKPARKSTRKAAAKKPAAKKTTRSRKKADPEAELKAKIVEFGTDGEWDDHEEFVDAVLEEMGEQVEEFDDLHADLLDEDGEIWEAVAEAD